MKKRKENLAFLIPIAGLIGMALQFYIKETAFDHKHLFVAGHPAVTVLYILMAAVLGFAFLLSRKVGNTQATFPVTPTDTIGGLIIALCAVFQSTDALLRSVDRISVILSVSGIAVAVSFVTDRLRQKKQQISGGLFYGTVSLFLLFYTLNGQQDMTLATQQIYLFFPLMACIFLTLSAFYRAYLSVGSKYLQLYLFFHHAAVFFSLTAIPHDPLLYGPLAASLLLMSQPVAKKQMALPKNVSRCLYKLNKAGYEAYVVGGCVRDSLLGITPHDYDMCTNATPEQIAKVFRVYDLVRNGEKHGTIGVVMDGQLYEITTFRTEGGYSDSRHPDWVEFVDNVTADLARRDFTVNAIAYSPETGYVDPFGGEKDLNNKILRTVGDPTDRFTEDALRILRGVRFAVRFRLEPEENTLLSMFALANQMESLARERVFAELSGLLPLITAEDLIRYCPIITQVIPELSPAVDFQQHSPHHAYDVYRHTAYVVEAVPADPALRFAALLHDVGKPETFIQDETGRGHFHGHAEVSARIADQVLLRLKAPTELRQQVVTLVENHMTALLPDKKLLRKRLSRFGEEMLKKILTLQKADFGSKGVEDEPEPFTELETLLNEVIAESTCLSIKDLAIDGNDLIALGIAPGPQMGEILSRLLEMVLDETLENEKAALLQKAEQLGGTR